MFSGDFAEGTLDDGQLEIFATQKQFIAEVVEAQKVVVGPLLRQLLQMLRRLMRHQTGHRKRSHEGIVSCAMTVGIVNNGLRTGGFPEKL